MQEEERNKWELDSLTTRQGCYPVPVRANFPTNHAFWRLLTYPHGRHRKFTPDGVFGRLSRPITCHGSQFFDFAPFAGLMTPKNGEIPTYTQTRGGTFYHDPAQRYRICFDVKRFTLLRVLIGGMKKTIMRVKSIQCLQQ